MAGTRRRDTGTRGLKPPLYDLWRWWPRGLKPPLCGHSHHGIALCTTLPSTTVSTDFSFLIASSGTRVESK